MRKALFASLLLVAAPGFAACSSSSDGATPTSDGGTDDAGGDGGAGDGGADAGDIEAPSASNIKHVVIIVQENHSFDDHFGHYCTAATGSNPTCNDGPGCCEAMPATDPTGAVPINLDDAAMAAYDPSHLSTCEDAEMNGGAMDKYTNAPSCGDIRNVAAADKATIKPLWDLAAKSALADRYFQSVSGQSSSNDMYLARANWVFTDNSAAAKDAIGTKCQLASNPQQYTDTTIGDLLSAANVPWVFYAEGYQRAKDAAASGNCMAPDPACAAQYHFYPCTFDPGDVPFDYYASTVDSPDHMKDIDELTSALTSGTGLPAVSYVKALGFKTEHPGSGDKLSDGVKFVTDMVGAVASSRYAADTLLIITYDESGGYYDHVAPPAKSAVDNQPYGPRIPTIAVGTFAKTSFISHVPMEHASLVKFIEWNWLGQKTGQLSTRDKVAANIGSLLDAAKTGTPVPEN